MNKHLYKVLILLRLVRCKMKFLYVTDTHIRGTTPKNRLDVYVDTLKEKLEEVIQVANRNKLISFYMVEMYLTDLIYLRMSLGNLQRSS